MISLPVILLLGVLVLPATGTAIIGVVPWRYRWRLFGGVLAGQLAALAAFVVDGSGWGVTVRVLPFIDPASLGLPQGECVASGMSVLTAGLTACCIFLVRLAGERLRSRRRAIGIGAIHLGLTLLALAGDLLVPVIALALLTFGIVTAERVASRAVLGRGGMCAAALLCAALVGSFGLGSLGISPEGAAVTSLPSLLDRAAVAMIVGTESPSTYILAALLPMGVLLVLLLLLPRAIEEHGGSEGTVVQIGVIAAPLLMLHLLQFVVLPLLCVDREAADVLSVLHIVASGLAAWWAFCALGTSSVGGVVGYLQLAAIALALSLLSGNLAVALDLVVEVAGVATVGAALALAVLARLGRGDHIATLDGTLRNSPLRRLLLLLGCAMIVGASATTLYLTLRIEPSPVAILLAVAVAVGMIAAVRLVRRVGWGVIRSPHSHRARAEFDRGALVALGVALLGLVGALITAEEITQGDRSILQRRMAPERGRAALETAKSTPVDLIAGRLP